MKITSLLAQYLYTNKRLDLPGIGSFFLDPSALIASEGNKQRSNILEGISFQNNPALSDSPDLIAYISAQTGKMKSLAASDVDSHLLLVQQFLNIGKPFTFEGIGTIVKLKTGDFEFISGTVTSEKLKEIIKPEGTGNSSRDDTGKKYESFLSEKKSTQSWRMPVTILLIICGAGLAVWGGYAISKKKSAPQIVTATEEVTTPAQTPKEKDTTTLVSPVDPSTIDKPIEKQVEQTTTPEDHYKYVLEVAQSKRAFQRYNQLRTNLWEVKLETQDSLQYKLYLLLPALNADTTRILDSLTVMTGKKVYIEHQN